jgi:putative sigma-54 modulation protein
MEIAIRARNVEVSDALRAAVQDKVTRATRHLDDMDRAEVALSEERNPRIADRLVVEVTLFGHGHVVRAKASGADPVAALDRVAEKLEQRLRRLKGKLVGRSHPRRPISVESAPDDLTRNDDEADTEDGQARIVKAKQFSIKPMTPEEAVLQMELLSHDFFFFTNADTHRAAVVYRRTDGNVGLIDAT